jgi:hypothetical protein
MGISPRSPIWGNTFVYTIQQTSATISGTSPLRADVRVLASLVHGLTSNEIRARTNWIQFVLPFKSGTYYTAYIIDRVPNHFNSFRMLSVPSLPSRLQPNWPRCRRLGTQHRRELTWTVTRRRTLRADIGICST